MSNKHFEDLIRIVSRDGVLELLEILNERGEQHPTHLYNLIHKDLYYSLKDLASLKVIDRKVNQDGERSTTYKLSEFGSVVYSLISVPRSDANLTKEYNNKRFSKIFEFAALSFVLTKSGRYSFPDFVEMVLGGRKIQLYSYPRYSIKN